MVPLDATFSALQCSIHVAICAQNNIQQPRKRPPYASVIRHLVWISRFGNHTGL